MYLNAAFKGGAVFHADAYGRDVSADRAFAADVDAVAALDVAGHFAHDYDFAGGDAGIDHAVAANGDAAFRHDDFAFDPAIDVKRFGAADFAFDHEGTADGGLINGRSDGFDWVVGVGVGSR